MYIFIDWNYDIQLRHTIEPAMCHSTQVKILISTIMMYQKDIHIVKVLLIHNLHKMTTLTLIWTGFGLQLGNSVNYIGVLTFGFKQEPMLLRSA